MYTYEDFLTEWRDGRDFITCRTSGSTGAPKHIRIPKVEVAKSARRTLDFFRLHPGAHLHSCISPEFIGGKMMAVRAEIGGALLSCETPSNRPLDEYSGGAIDLLAVVPSQMIHILDNLGRMPEIRHIIIGGARIEGGLRNRIAASGLDAWETYGMTETASHIALRKVEEPERTFSPLPGIKVWTDETRRLVIEMEGWQRIVTNDIAEINPGGEFRICGRADNVINTGGKKVHPEQVEETLEAVLGHEILITSRPDPKWGERVVMIIDDGRSEADNVKIMQQCRDILPKECLPKEIIHAHVEHTPNGKKKRTRHLND